MKKNKNREKIYQFDVALSFAGEDRQYVEKVANILRKMGIKVFYDKYETATLWGKDLYEHVNEIYSTKARYTIMFISKYYARKLWTNHERKAAQERAFKSNQEYILPVRFDNTRIPGILSTVGYVNLKNFRPSKLAKLIKEKLGPIERFDYLPNEYDVLYEVIGVKSKKKEYEIDTFVHEIFESLKLMTKEERILLYHIISNSCPAGPPDNFHLDIEYLTRISGLSSTNILSMISRLDCLGIKAKIVEEENHDNELCHSRNMIHIQYVRYLDDIKNDNGTYVIDGIVQTFNENLCPDCRMRAFARADFSILSSLSGYSEK